jgi:hypothetical protein
MLKNLIVGFRDSYIYSEIPDWALGLPRAADAPVSQVYLAGTYFYIGCLFLDRRNCWCLPASALHTRSVGAKRALAGG